MNEIPPFNPSKNVNWEVAKPSGPRLAKHIELTRKGRNFSMKIDGEEFPFYSELGSVDVGVVDRDEAPGVTLRIVADKVTVMNSLDD